MHPVAAITVVRGYAKLIQRTREAQYLSKVITFQERLVVPRGLGRKCTGTAHVPEFPYGRLHEPQQALADADAQRAAAEAGDRERRAAEAMRLRAVLAGAQGAAQQLQAARDAARADARAAELRLADVQASVSSPWTGEPVHNMPAGSFASKGCDIDW